RGLAIADLDAERIDEDKFIESMAARRGDFGSEPAAKREPNQSDLSGGQHIKRGEIEMHQVVNRVEILVPRRVAKAGGRGCNNLAVASEQLEKRRLPIDCLKTVEQEDRVTRAATQNFEFDSVHRQPLGIGVSHQMLPDRSSLRARCIASMVPIR